MYYVIFVLYLFHVDDISFSCFLIFFSFATIILVFFFFFFSSRRRHTRSLRDWSSDVCSSDLVVACSLQLGASGRRVRRKIDRALRRRQARRDDARRSPQRVATDGAAAADRSEERRVGKECRSRWAQSHRNKKEVGGEKYRMIS